MIKGRKALKFGRKRDARRIFFRSLIRSLVIHNRIKTTLHRARAIRPMIEKLITRSRESTIANKRFILGKLGNDENTMHKIMSLGKRYYDRPGGYIRITKLSTIKNDGRTEVIVEFV